MLNTSKLNNQKNYNFCDMFNKICSYKDIIITGHLKPDGDAIGSCMAIAFILSKLGKKPIVALESIPTKYDIISGKEFLYNKPLKELNNQNCDVFISLDCGSISRITNDIIPLFDKALLTINIDHHASNIGFAQINILDFNASSTSEIVYKIFKDSFDINQYIDKNIATALYAGIIYDSGGLRFKTTTPETMKAVTILMETGIDYPAIYANVLLKNSFGSVKALKKALANLEIYPDLKLAVSTITIKEMQEEGFGFDDIDYIVSYLINIEGTEVAAFIYESKPNLFKISLRSLYIDVNKIAYKFNGGGHVNAAGCTFEGTKEDALKNIKNNISEWFYE